MLKIINFCKWLYKKYKEENPEFKDPFYMSIDYMKHLEVESNIKAMQIEIENCHIRGACSYKKMFRQEYLMHEIAMHFQSKGFNVRTDMSYSYDHMYYVLIEWSDIIS